MARPSKFTQAIAGTICERIAEGKSLRSICEDGKMPAARTVHRWLADEKRGDEFRQQYARARIAQADTLFDQILAIADDGKNDTHKTEDGREIVDHEHIQRSRLRVDARKWMAAKLAPKKYGEKLALGGDDTAPPIEVIQRVIVDPQNPDS